MYSDQANWHCIHPQDYVTELQNHHSPNPVNCGACKCVIVGKTLNCAACKSHLHLFCQTLRETINSEIHPDHHLTRLNRDCFQLLTRRRCAVCSDEIKGVSYTCSPCNFDVHPQCSQLPCRVPHGSEAHHEFVLQLETLPITNCHVCGDRCGQWAYRCDVCSVNVHFECLVSHREGGPTTSSSRGLERHFDPLRQLQGQVNYGLPLPVYFPPHYYNYYNAGVYQHHHWGVIQYHIYNNNYYNGNHPGGGWNQLNHGGGGGNGGGGSGRPANVAAAEFFPSGSSGGGDGSGGSGSSSGGGGRIMRRIGKNLAVGLICNFVITLIMAGIGG